MHDMKMRELKVGDHVLIPCRITKIEATENYCNVTLESAAPRRPDGQKETIYSINSGVTLRCNVGDYSASGPNAGKILMWDLEDAFVIK